MSATWRSLLQTPVPISSLQELQSCYARGVALFLSPRHLVFLRNLPKNCRCISYVDIVSVRIAVKQKAIKRNALKPQLFTFSLSFGVIYQRPGQFCWSKLGSADTSRPCSVLCLWSLGWEPAGLGGGVTQLCCLSSSRHPKVFLVPVERFQEILWTCPRPLGA